MDTNQRLKKIKCIVSDVDGTLLTDNGELGIETKKLINDLMEQGVIFSLSTGRLHSATVELAKELSLNGFIISLDGAVIKEYRTDKTIFEAYISSRNTEKAIAISEDLLVNLVLCHSSSIYFTEYNSLIPSLLNRYGARYTQVDSYDEYIPGTLEIICASDMMASIKKMEERFNFPYSIGCNTSYFRSKNNENIFYLEIRKAGSSKRKALLRLLRHLSLKTDQAAVTGDWYNDITAFQTKTLKVAVSNAVPELLNMADIVTKKSNNENGIDEFLEMILKSKRN